VRQFMLAYTSLQPLALASAVSMMRYNDAVGAMSNILDPTFSVTLKNMMLGEAVQNPDFSSILFANVLGDGITVRNTSGAFAVGYANHTSKLYNFNDVNPDNGTVGGYNSGLSQKNYDPRTRPWYVAGKVSKTMVWAPVFTNLGNPPTLVFSCAAPFYNISNPSQLLAIMAAQFTLAKISDFLVTQAASAKADIFVIERDTSLIASSNGLVYSVNGSTVVRLKAAQHSSFIVVDTSNYLLNVNGGNLLNLTSDFEGSFTDSLGYVRVVMATNVRDTFGMDWITVVILSNSELMSVVNQGTMFAGIVSAIAVICAAIAAIGFGFCISIPLRGIGKEMQYVANMDLDSRSATTLRLNEFHVMSASMDQMKQGLSNFQKFVPSDVVRKLLRSNAKVKLGVRKRPLTLLFMDIKDFTTITESIDPNMLISLMSKFFTQMGEAIMENHGTIDKFIGDCIMAMWNAPEQIDNHELCALNAVFDMRRRLEELNLKWARKRYPEVVVRVGVNTSISLVGNIGAPNRINYTALGDGVNVAARLEALNKHWDTKVLIGETTYEAVKSNYLCRWVDYASLKGKNNPIDIYEAICPADVATLQQRRECDQHELMKGYLKEARYNEVKTMCKNMLEENVQNTAAKRLFERMSIPNPTVALTLHEK
jgi:adenylate cyclase